MTILVVSGGFLFRRLITRRQRQYSIESR
jgi:hypothetical protein